MMRLGNEPCNYTHNCQRVDFKMSVVFGESGAAFTQRNQAIVLLVHVNLPERKRKVEMRPGAENNDTGAVIGRYKN